MTKDEAWKLAHDWIAAWNAHDLELILSHYDDAIVLTSPVAARLLGSLDGKVTGTANVRAYFQRGTRSLSATALRPAGCVLGRQQCCASLRKSSGDAHGGIHGVVGQRKNRPRGSELQRLKTRSAFAALVSNYNPDERSGLRSSFRWPDCSTVKTKKGQTKK
jgi:hypothetical protein